jgi:hypothetical protein
VLDKMGLVAGDVVCAKLGADANAVAAKIAKAKIRMLVSFVVAKEP